MGNDYSLGTNRPTKDRLIAEAASMNDERLPACPPGKSDGRHNRARERGHAGSECVRRIERARRRANDAHRATHDIDRCAGNAHHIGHPELDLIRRRPGQAKGTAAAVIVCTPVVPLMPVHAAANQPLHDTPASVEKR